MNLIQKSGCRKRLIFPYFCFRVGVPKVEYRKDIRWSVAGRNLQGEQGQGGKSARAPERGNDPSYSYSLHS